jgi:hypothetical protein
MAHAAKARKLRKSRARGNFNIAPASAVAFIFTTDESEMLIAVGDDL